MQMKEEWRFAAMECGGLSGMQDGIVVMLLLPVGNLDCISHIQVCSESHNSMQLGSIASLLILSLELYDNYVAGSAIL